MCEYRIIMMLPYLNAASVWLWLIHMILHRSGTCQQCHGAHTESKRMNRYASMDHQNFHRKLCLNCQEITGFL